ncbi:YebC/PmpR family DNA-binding transcriptional regulator [Prosthecochloris sp. N3]|uniref:Probable transcriptional regulatory protein INT08_02895 n=1 Tax=Prosthecochloris ethylica TaxID=2743976 RepID=A0ABR9XQQ0_9CHLB|nr:MULTISPECIES: YebC/PmpR family DNA-binding transcriptional regulator [Prosthecochloris]MEC9485894.1 YebC/PmpR family DNA-binding transcriptional regulator [Prosthecochloris sp.]MBF0586518.1 YebC/PmpR family DNA-binding transcriptional regulator [Prosthecochloris ethylica]MBF0636131.1 YebC/PmpR family DNA-binding transcriptional regulator [Prosthecochloris ethylica]NUK47732.1 YebC/PmpR family DNA-binding transcriptional regulator [Prosthecochloris ethylica]RNA64394.1 YebC/PmpR family DNA-bin
MSGHSKWSTIKRKKAATDQKRGNLFTKLVREITIAAKMGGGDPAANPRLRLAVDNAKASSMPQENIQRAIKKGTGELEGVTYEEITYEGYGPGGIALIIETATDNRNRTVADVRHIINRHNGSLGENGSVSWMFQRKGCIEVARAEAEEDRLMEVLLDAGLEDLNTDDESYFTVITDVRELENAKQALDDAGICYENARVDMIPDTYVELDASDAEKAMKLIDALENSDDVQAVYSNLEISEQAMNSFDS